MNTMTKTLATALSAALVATACGPKESPKLIALSFDDGPNLVTTPLVLDVLEENGIKASFFVEGQYINDTTAAMMLRASALGCDIENHSWSHQPMSTLSDEEINTEIYNTSALIEKYVGHAPRFFRPPYIDHNKLMHSLIGLTFICGQGCDDWVPEVTAQQRADSVIAHAADGQIVLLHDFEGNTNTVEALKTIIPELKARGFEFVTVPELFEAKGVALEPNNGKIYTNVLTD